MKRKFLLILILFSCLFITKVYADDPVGSMTNPDVCGKSTDCIITRDQMIELDVSGSLLEGNHYLYYAVKINLPNNSYLHYYYTTPVLNSDETGYYSFYVTKPGSDFEQVELIDGDSDDIPKYYNRGSLSVTMKSGEYYLIATLIVEGDNDYDYTMRISYNTTEVESVPSTNDTGLELEPNNNLDDATGLELDFMHHAEIGFLDSNDVYSFNLTANKKVRVYFANFEELKVSFTFTIHDELFVEDFGKITSSKMKYDNNRGQYYYEFTPTKSRVYYLKLSGYGEKVEYEIGIYQSGSVNEYLYKIYSYYDAHDVFPSGYMVFRMYSPSNGEHLYTIDANEARTLFKYYGWGCEGVGWISANEGTPVYRLYNPGLGNHLYTSDEYEVSELTKYYGWVKDNNGQPVMYSYYDEDHIVPVYRVYNEAMSGMHHLTTDENEYNALPQYGWKQEDIVMYAKSEGQPFLTEYYHVNF